MDIKNEYKQEEYDGDENVSWIERRLIIVPGCCEASKRGRGVAIQLSADDIYENEEGQKNCVPKWELYRGFHYKGDRAPERLEVSFCPYCGSKMPKIRRRKEPLVPICNVNDGGYYCSTCEERLHACKCWPCEAHWEADE